MRISFQFETFETITKSTEKQFDKQFVINLDGKNINGQPIDPTWHSSLNHKVEGRSEMSLASEITTNNHIAFVGGTKTSSYRIDGAG